VALAELSGGLLPVLNEAMPARLVPVLREFLQRHGGARDVGVLLADYELLELRRLSPRDQDDLTVAVSGTAAGQCFGGQFVVSDPTPDG